MGRDRSLDEFFGDDGDADDDRSESLPDADDDAGATDDDSGAADGATDVGAGADTDTDADAGPGTDVDGDDGTAGEGLPDAAAVDPSTPTHRWVPEGAACESCGTVVERLWIDDGAFVCDDCKEW